MSSRRMSLLPRATLHGDSEQVWLDRSNNILLLILFPDDHSSHLDVGEGIGVEVMGEGVTHPPVPVGQQRQVEEVSTPGLYRWILMIVLQGWAIYTNINFVGDYHHWHDFMHELYIMPYFAREERNIINIINSHALGQDYQRVLIKKWKHRIINRRLSLGAWE
jgi:hypothetical protein